MEVFSDVVLLSRIQFALTIMFHYLYPPLSIGLGLLLVVMEGMYLRTGNPIYEAMTKFWVKIFALNFSLGVASGIVMEFEFGTNWATYSRFVGDVFGSALAAEGIFAFFLESGFLAVLVFGWNRVSRRMHFLSTVMVSLGSIFSSVWIVVANSWQQTPAGYHIVTRDAQGNIVPTTLPYSFDGLMNGAMPRAEISDFWAMVFNPSSMSRLTHVLLGCFILGAFVVMSVCAFYILRGRHLEFARRCLPLALALATAASWGQLLAGHWSAKVAAEHQPAKLAAFEGLYRTEARAPAYLFGIPDSESETVKWGVAVPGLLSFLVHEDFDKPVTGLDAFAKEDRPPVQIPFQMYHLMVGLGMIFIGFTTLASFLHLRGRLFETKWLLRLMVPAVVLPYIANQAGWIAAEVGRQPWIVYGELRTTEGVSRNLAAGNVAFSLILFTLIYALLFVMFLYLLDRKIKHGPDEPSAAAGDHGGHSTLIEAAGARAPGGGRLASGEVAITGEA